MDKTKACILVGVLTSILIVAVSLMMILPTGRNGGSVSDSSGIPFASFFVMVILPAIIAHKKKREEESTRVEA